MESEIGQLHRRHKNMIKEVEEDFLDDNFSRIQEWKNTAKARMNMYKKVIKELITQMEQLEKEKAEVVTELKDEIGNRRYEIEGITKQYENDQQMWQSEKDRYEMVIHDQNNRAERFKENENRLISYEGQIEDLNMHIGSIKRDYENLVRKHRKEMEEVERGHVERSVKD